MTAEPVSPPAAIRVDLGAIFVSLELSKFTWLVTSLFPGSEKMSRHAVPGGDMPALLVCLKALRDKARARERERERERRLYPMMVIQEAGLDGFGSTAHSRRRIGSRAMLSTPPRSRCRVGAAGRRPTASTARRWYAR